MTIQKTSYAGQLLAANPLNPKDSLENGVILVVSHATEYSLGLQINRPLTDFTIGEVGAQVGLFIDLDDPVYYGGNITTNKIHIIHSNDWSGLTTIKINDEISVTNDISVLVAMSKNEGPEYFRACAGFWGWESGQLENQLSAIPNQRVRHRWEPVTATLENVFGQADQDDHWRSVLNEAARERVSSWF